MKNQPDPESLLAEQLALCTAALAECVEGARVARSADHGARRTAELGSAVALLNASARLGAALARIKGDIRQTIRVEREGVAHDGGSNGQSRRRGRPNG